MSVFDYFDQVYCINLDDRTDRWKQAESEFRKVGLQSRVQRFPGVQAAVGWEGNKQSHIRLVRKAKREGVRRLLVFEDDVILVEGAEHYVGAAVEQLAEVDAWAFFYLGSALRSPAKRVAPNLLRLTGAYCTHAYAIDESVFDRVLLAETVPVPIDVFLRDLHPQVPAYHIDPIVALQSTGYSDGGQCYRGNMTGWMLGRFARFGGRITRDPRVLSVLRSNAGDRSRRIKSEPDGVLPRS